MKLFVVATILGVCLADRLDNKYLPPRGNQGAGYSGGNFGSSAPSAFGQGGSGFAQGGSGFGQGGAGFGQGGAGFRQGAGGFSQGGFGAPNNAYGAPSNGFGSSGRSGSSADANAQILKLNSEVTAEGFSYDFETSNGIRADASGVATNGVQSQGSFAYKGDDGQDYSITYTADENGYQPRGAHLPTPPPIPEAILKSLEQNARDEAAGIHDDGTYRGEGAGAGAGGYPTGPAGGYSGASNSFGAGNSGSFGGNQPSGGFGQKTFGSATSRQYLTPNAGPRGSGSGNFNPQSGYRY